MLRTEYEISFGVAGLLLYILDLLLTLEVTDGAPVEMALPAENMMPIEEVIEECGECAGDGVIVEEVPCVEEVPAETICPAVMKPSFLKRFHNWLSR